MTIRLRSARRDIQRRCWSGQSAQPLQKWREKRMMAQSEPGQRISKPGNNGKYESAISIHIRRFGQMRR
jgi:hypothetical protein